MSVSDMAVRALGEALHRANLPECEPDADDYSDEMEHRFAAHDLLDSLRSRGWVLARTCGDLEGVCLLAGPHEGPHKVASPKVAREALERLGRAVSA